MRRLADRLAEGTQESAFRQIAGACQVLKRKVAAEPAADHLLHRGEAALRQTPAGEAGRHRLALRVAIAVNDMHTDCHRKLVDEKGAVLQPVADRGEQGAHQPREHRIVLTTGNTQFADTLQVRSIGHALDCRRADFEQREIEGAGKLGSVAVLKTAQIKGIFREIMRRCVMGMENPPLMAARKREAEKISAACRRCRHRFAGRGGCFLAMKGQSGGMDAPVVVKHRQTAAERIHGRRDGNGRRRIVHALVLSLPFFLWT